MRGGMKEGRPPHPQLRAPPTPSSSLWTVPDESWKPWQQARTQESAEKRKERKGKKINTGSTRRELWRSHPVICLGNKKNKI